MEPNTDANEMSADVWTRAGVALSAWEKQQAAREFQRRFDSDARDEAALHELRAARQARRKERQQALITWLIFAAVGVAVIWGICVGGFE